MLERASPLKGQGLLSETILARLLKWKSKLESIPTDVDIVIIRHQQLLSINAPWGKIFKQAIDRVSKTGIILVTSYGEVEHKEMVKAMEKLGGKVVLDETVPNAKSMGFPQVFMDGKVAVIKKCYLPDLY